MVCANLSCAGSTANLIDDELELHYLIAILFAQIVRRQEVRPGGYAHATVLELWPTIARVSVCVLLVCELTMHRYHLLQARNFRAQLSHTSVGV